MNPLWQFSIDFYQRPGIEAACLTWQEHFGADVNVLLFCLWCATAGRALNEGTLGCLLADPRLSHWQRDVVVPLRAVRCASKSAGVRDDEDQVVDVDGERPLAKLYQALLAAELQAEEVEQRLLWQWARDNLAVTNAGRLDQVVLVARQNLLLYGRLLSVADPEGSLFPCFDDALRVGWGASAGEH